MPFSLRPTHLYLEGEKFERIQLTAREWNEYYHSIGLTSDSPAMPSPLLEEALSPMNTESSPLSSATDPHSIAFLGPIDSYSEIWDRLPVADHKDLEFPSKVSTR